MQSMSVSEYLLLNKNISSNLLEKSKKMSWHDINISADSDTVEIRRKIGEVRSEIHKLRGFVRFNSINDNILFGYIKPQHKTGRIVTDSFAKRFQNNIIILGNEKMVWISYYSKNNYLRYEDKKNLKDTLDQIKLLIKDAKELDIEKIWETYYNSQFIKEREDHNLFYKNMPRKYLRASGNKVELKLNSKTLDEYMDK